MLDTDFFSAAIYIAQRLWIGVPMFFVISGYCISATAESTLNRNHSAGTYFWRRVRRIYPPFWIFLASTFALLWVATIFDKNWLFSGMGGDYRSMSAYSWLGQLTLTESWLPHVLGHDRTYFVNHAWTLCYEEQFYFVVGMILLIAPRRFFLASILVTIATIGLRFAFGTSTKGFFFDGYWVLFAAGILVYYATNHADYWRKLVSMSVFVVIAVASSLYKTLFLQSGHAGSLSAEHFFVGAIFAFALCALRPLDNQMSASSWLRPLNICGLWCYSLYLVHWPITLAFMLFLSGRGVRGNALTVCVTIPVCVAVSVAVAYVFHRCVESRFLNSSLQRPNTAGHTSEPTGNTLQPSSN